MAGALLAALFPLVERRRASQRRSALAGGLLLAAFSLVLMSWAAPWPPGPAARAALGLLLPAAAFQSVRGGLRACLQGLLLGLFLTALGWAAWRWAPLAAALSVIGTGFLGNLLTTALPLALAASCALTAAALLHEDLRPARWGLAGGLAALWLGGAALAQARLRRVWDFGPASLAEAAGIPPAGRSGSETVFVLREAGRPAREVRPLSARAVDASPESLERLQGYLAGRGWRSLFVKEGAAALREGWLARRRADKALDALSLSVPGLVVPDYIGALRLLRAGPLTPERFARLQALERTAQERPGPGFEDVKGAQRTFEAFSAAFARFGDAERARAWLLRIDGLWPIYDKKIDVTPLEGMRDGELEGEVRRGARPAAGVEVALYYELQAGTAPVRSAAVLSGAAVSDAQGRFRFEDLGQGRYHLELSGVDGEVEDAPGAVRLTPTYPTHRLKPIVLGGVRFNDSTIRRNR